MAIRTKIETQCSSWITGYDTNGTRIYDRACVNYQVNIVDWNVWPELAKFDNTTAPASFTQKITVPELQDIYPSYDYFKWKISFNNSSPVDWVTPQSPSLEGDFLNLNPGETADINYAFKNIATLPNGLATLVVKVQAYGVNGGVETLLQNESVTGNIEFTKSGASGVFTTDREVYNLQFNRSTNTLSGDTQIKIYSKTGVSWGAAPFSLGVTSAEVADGTVLDLALASTTFQDGGYTSGFDLMANGQQKTVTVNLEVLNNATQFYVSPSSFDLQLMLADNLNSGGSVIISNPNKLTINLESFPAFLETCAVNGNKVDFTTKKAQELGTGLYSGNIILKSGAVSKTIFVKLSVVEHIKNDFTGSAYYFALDKKAVTLNKVSPTAVKVEMQLDMFFSGYGQNSTESQKYESTYFKNSVTFYPGDEVNDFFLKLRSKRDLFSNFLAYQFALVTITLRELDSSDNVLNTFSVPNLRFAPGYKPKCFPFFTDFGVRSVYEKSQILISADTIGTKPELASLEAVLNSGANVQTWSKKKTDLTDIPKIDFIPLPEIAEVAHIFWETHNLVFDWFTASEKHTRPADFDHTISDNVTNGEEEKFGTKQTDTLTLNTGWLLEEETELIDALIASNFCLIYLKGKLYRCLPQTKKNALRDSETNKFSMDLEFKILKDAR